MISIFSVWTSPHVNHLAVPASEQPSHDIHPCKIEPALAAGHCLPLSKAAKQCFFYCSSLYEEWLYSVVSSCTFLHLVQKPRRDAEVWILVPPSTELNYGLSPHVIWIISFCGLLIPTTFGSKSRVFLFSHVSLLPTLSICLFLPTQSCLMCLTGACYKP